MPIERLSFFWARCSASMARAWIMPWRRSTMRRWVRSTDRRHARRLLRQAPDRLVAGLALVFEFGDRGGRIAGQFLVARGKRAPGTRLQIDDARLELVEAAALIAFAQDQRGERFLGGGERGLGFADLLFEQVDAS